MISNENAIDENVSAAGCTYLFGRFQLNIAEDNQATLLSDGHAVALGPAASTILRVLVENRGQFVKTADLLNYVSRSPRASENIVHGAVLGLRRTLNDADLIISERGKGYRFTGAIEVRSPEIPDVIAIEASPGTNGSLPQSPFPSDDNQPVTTASNKKRNPFVVVALLVCVPVFVLPFGLVFFGGPETSENLFKQLGFIQALVILVAIGYDFYFARDRDSPVANAETRRAWVAVQQLRRCWRLLLACWCCLYLTLPFSQWLAPLSSGQMPSLQWQALQVFATFLNNASALMLVLCYVVLNRPTVISVSNRDVEDVPLRSGLFLVGGVGLLEAFLVAIFGWVGSPDYARHVLFGADLLSGVAGGIAMALCISRLGSRLLGRSGLLPVVPIVLYFYVVIQPFYPLVNRTFPNRLGDLHFDLWIIQLAFLLKSVMYIYVTELFRNERFLFYMIHARRVYGNVETEWMDFKSGSGS